MGQVHFSMKVICCTWGGGRSFRTNSTDVYAIQCFKLRLYLPGVDLTGAKTGCKDHKMGDPELVHVYKYCVL